MIGCPVDAIHRGRHQQIVIEDHCIGCGLCAQNCPYGNISMEPDLKKDAWRRASPGRLRVLRLQSAIFVIPTAFWKCRSPSVCMPAPTMRLIG